MEAKISNQIISPDDIERILNRMAYQILEQRSDADLYLIGIQENGVLIADRLYTLIQKISNDLNVYKGAIQVDKLQPRNPVKCSLPLNQMENSVVIVVDDVLNTGSTLMYAVRYFLDIPLKQLKAAVLVNRSHKTYPVKADIKGISLSTSTNEHIEVDFKNQMGVLLK